MTEAVAPDRAARPGGRWSTPGLVDELLDLAAVERAAVHVAMGWVPKVPELDDKLALAATIEDGMVRAVGLRQQALTLLERDDEALTVDPAVVVPLRRLDVAAAPDVVVDGVIGGAHRFLLARHRALSTRLDPLYDARLLTVVRSAIDALERSTSGAGPGAGPSPSGDEVLAALGRSWSTASGDRARGVALDEALWGPADRVPVPARPAGRPRPEAGARAHLRSMSRLEHDDIAGELNDNVMAELSALELLCRCSYEHPELPWSSHLALARHIADEERHAAIFRRLLVERGYDEGELLQHGANYEFAYEFPECEPGSAHELVWRLLILCTVLEALAIDKLPVEIASRDWLGQSDIARALDYISTDELFHTENGLRLTRQLCEQHGLHPMLERERVHGRFFGRQYAVRAAYLQADPERAAREIEILEGRDPDDMPFTSRTEVDLRRRASFTDEECEQVERWGYNPRRHPALDPAPG